MSQTMDSLRYMKMFPRTLSAYLTAIVHITCIFKITLCMVPVQIPQTVPQFSISDSNHLEHVAVHNISGDVYLGAHNMIYKLDGDLDFQSQQNWLTAGMETTPCPSENGNCDSGVSTEVNQNKVLLVDYEHGLLLSCGSSHFGTCVLHSLDSVADIEGRIGSNLANDSIAVGETVVAYFGKFSPNGRLYSALYVASTYEDNPPSPSLKQHALATKRLSKSADGQWQLKLAYKKEIYGRYTYIDLRNEEVKQNFKIKYVYGFSIDDEPGLGFSYFLTVQRDDVDQQDYKSKIVRICHKDKGYYSYTELTLKCKSSTGSNLRILQAAYLGKAGTNMTNSMNGVESDEHILYAVFSQSVNVNSREPAQGSALCVYPMGKVNDRIRNGLDTCFSGRGTRGLEHIERSENQERLDCSDQYGNLQIGNDFCGTSSFHPIDTHKSFSAKDILRGSGDNEIFTSVIARARGEDTIAVIGTQSGHLMKFLLQPEGDESANAGIPYKNLLLNGPVLQDMAFDPRQEHVYAMTSETMYKFSLTTCDHYIECSACILTHDPNGCGWCGSGCATRDECLEEGGSWTREVCPPVIYKVSPPSAPLNSPVYVTLIGDNLGTGLAQVIHDFSIVGKPCIIQPAYSDNNRIVCRVEPVTAPVTGPIIAHVEATSVEPAYRVNGTNADFSFSFMESTIDRIKPPYGQRAGGTNLTISGVGLNSGNNRAVTVAGLPCQIQSSNNTALVCTTSESSTVTAGIVELSIDGKRFVSQQQFTYILPPTIASFSPNSSYVSGGRQLIVHGANLNVLEEPKIVITIPTKNEQTYNIEETCQRAGFPGSFMVCGSPDITVYRLTASANQPITAYVSFILDEWYDTPVAIGPDMLYYPNPSFNSFPAIFPVSRGSELHIEGANLDLASNASEITVMVRDEACEVTKLTRTNLVCTVPSLEYTSEENNMGHQVTITVGNYQANIGLVHYEKSSGSQTTIALSVTFVFFLLTGAVLAVLFWFLRKGKRKPVGLTSEQITLARSISHTGSQGGSEHSFRSHRTASVSTSQLSNSGEGRVAPFRSGRLGSESTSQLSASGEGRVAPFGTGRLASVSTMSQFSGDGRLLSNRTASTSVSQYSGESMLPPHGKFRTGSTSASQFSGEAHVRPMSPLRTNTYLKNPSRSAESFVKESRPLLQQISNELASQVSGVLVNEGNLKLGDTIGQGQFGCVYEGQFIQDGEELHVAVKSLLHGTKKEIANFLREGIMMRDFKHKNVLQLIGVCIKDDQIPLVILPYMKLGDLLTYIRCPQHDLTARQLLQFSRDIADGMAYLADLKFVHRDLAARNCMLDTKFNVKVADFGLSRDIYERDYYSAKDKSAKLPVRWMALECLERNVYSVKTDVWSFGVAMWELMTRGLRPYPTVDHCDLSTFLQQGQRLPQPPHCPDNVFDVMYSCWLINPIDRPSFRKLVEVLDEILATDEANTAAGFEDVYINLPGVATQV